jgi:hypothetical protein
MRAAARNIGHLDPTGAERAEDDLLGLFILPA